MGQPHESRHEARSDAATVTTQDREELTRAAALLRDVIARHRGEDLRVISILTDAIQGIHVGTRYLGASGTPSH